MSCDYIQPWYHGSPEQLTYLRKGSTITQDQNLARVFSHKPALVECYRDAHGQLRIKHAGTRSGYLYRIAEPVHPEDVSPHPRSSMEPGLEWIINRELRVELIAETQVVPAEQFTPAEIEELYRRIAEPSTGVVSPKP